MHKIAHSISGDYAIEHEDCVQALWIAVIDAIDGFTRQKDGINGAIEDFINTKGFDQYIKTVLWNCKNKCGADIKKKYSIQRDVVPIISNPHKGEDNEYHIEPVDDSQNWIVTGETIFNDWKDSLTNDERRMVSTILNNPDSVTEDGKIILKVLAKELDIPYHKIYATYSSLKQKLGVLVA